MGVVRLGNTQNALVMHVPPRFGAIPLRASQRSIQQTQLSLLVRDFDSSHRLCTFWVYEFR